MKRVEFVVEGDTLIGHIFLPKTLKKKQPSFLVVHGWTSKQNRGFHLARALAKQGYIVMTFDLRGHGVSDRKIEELSRKNFLKDVTSAYDFFLNISNVDARKITVVGSSFGGYLASLLSAERKVDALVLRVPANYQDEGFTQPQYKVRTKKNVTQWKTQFQKHTATKALRALYLFKGKILIVESEKDELVPAQVVQSYGNAVQNKKKLTYKIMKNAPHSISRHPKFQRQYRDIVLDWLE